MSRLLTTEFNSPLVDPKTGRVTKEWMRKLANAVVLDQAGTSLNVSLGRTLRVEGSTASDNNFGYSQGGNGFFGIDANGVVNGRLVVLNNGNVGINQPTPTSKLSVVGLQAFANNAAAITGGLKAGDLYRTGGDPDTVCVVH